MNSTLQNDILTAVIDPKGAELISLTGTGREYIWEGNPEYWGKHSPVLFPVVGKLKNNTYRYKDKTFTLTRHGFARDNNFTVKAAGTTSVVFSLAAGADTMRVYPFDFELEIKYTIKARTLTIDYMVKNNGTADMPFSLGAHPAFALPGNFSDYSLQFEAGEELLATPLENDLLTDETLSIPLDKSILPLSYDLFKNDAIVLKQMKSRRVRLLEIGSPIVEVNFKKFPHLGIWTKDKAPFICIEPWQGYADNHNATGNILEKEGIVVLKPSESHETGLSITIL